jgi:hypothetical protein
MTGTPARLVRFGTALLGLAAFGWFLVGHAAEPARQGLPTDWSHRHLVFSHPSTPEQIRRVVRDPRYWQQWYRQHVARVLTVNPKDRPGKDHDPRLAQSKAQGLWSEDLGSGASVGPGNYPAKFSFSTTEASCANDYVVFSTGLLGSSSQASVVGFNNLYTGCGGNVPTTAWAYNTNGQILTSPVTSVGGTQVAFVQTNAGEEGTLVLLKWAASGGTYSSPATITFYSASNYRACVAPCYTTIGLVDKHGTPTDDTTSSVFPDYEHDTIWVGGALGWLHKITGVFRGTPGEVTSGGFPTQVNDTTWISSPVYDSASTNVFVGDASGFLYRVDSSNGTVTPSAQLDFGTGLVDAPIVDSTNGLVYVFASSDGSTSCSAETTACAAVYQLTTTFASDDVGTEVEAGASVAYGTLPNPNPMYIGAFDSDYYNSLDGTGNLYVCGNTGLNPTVYQIPITAGVMPVSGEGSAVLGLTSSIHNPSCSPVTDVLNPNLTGGATERFFASTQNYGSPTACGNAGCVLSLIDTAWHASTTYQLSQEILDPNLNIETEINTTGESGLTMPAWSITPGTVITDNSASWVNQGPPSAAPLPAWTANDTHYRVGNRILDSNLNVEVVYFESGSSGATTPPWSTRPGGTTTDSKVKWVNAGALPTGALSTAGGTGGIIVDNVVISGTLAGTSQVYFGTLANQTCVTSTGSGGCAVQASQSALQ